MKHSTTNIQLSTSKSAARVKMIRRWELNVEC